jgi:hypothetical protein
VHIPASPEIPGFDRLTANDLFIRTLGLPGGPDLVVSSLSNVPGAVASRGRTGFFRAQEPSVQLSDWLFRSEARTNGPACMTVCHVVGGIVLAEVTLPLVPAAAHLTAALALHMDAMGPGILPEVLAVLEGLSVASST